jgi:hypothetical protein
LIDLAQDLLGLAADIGGRIVRDLPGKIDGRPVGTAWLRRGPICWRSMAVIGFSF